MKGQGYESGDAPDVIPKPPSGPAAGRSRTPEPTNDGVAVRQERRSSTADWPLSDDTSECEEDCVFGPPHRGTCLVPERHSARCRGGVCAPECLRFVGPRKEES